MEVLSQNELIELIDLTLNQWTNEEEELNCTSDGLQRFEEAQTIIVGLIYDLKFKRKPNTTGQSIALDTYLSEYPQNMSFNELLESISDKELHNMPDNIVPCEHYECFYPPLLAEMIQDLADVIDIKSRTII